ncbi:hypothetical protein BU23DRAFT_458978, partial [Bimuria novae-zelandiae CBS 107.79]
QEEGLVEYIRGLTARGLPPTRAIIQNFASNILKSMSERARFRVLLTATITILSLNRALAWTLYATRLTYNVSTSYTLTSYIIRSFSIRWSLVIPII